MNDSDVKFLQDGMFFPDLIIIHRCILSAIRHRSIQSICNSNRAKFWWACNFYLKWSEKHPYKFLTNLDNFNGLCHSYPISLSGSVPPSSLIAAHSEYINRPATYNDFFSILYKFFTLRIWQNTDFLPWNLAKYKFSSYFLLVIQIFFLKYWFSVWSLSKRWKDFCWVLLNMNVFFLSSNDLD